MEFIVEAENIAENKSVFVESFKRCSSYKNVITQDKGVSCTNSCPHCETNYGND